MVESADLPAADALVVRLCGAINLLAQAADDARMHGAPSNIAINTALQGVGAALLAVGPEKPSGRPHLRLIEGGRP